MRSSEIEDGFGFSGLMSTKAEEAEDRERIRVKALERRLAEAEALLYSITSDLSCDCLSDYQKRIDAFLEAKP